MKILTIHSDFIEIEPKTKAIKAAEQIDKAKYIKINLSDFPDSFYLELNSEKRKEIFKQAANKVVSLPKLAKKLNVSWRSFWNWFHGRRALKLETLRNICNIAGIELNSIQKYIEKVKGDTYCRKGLKLNLPFEVNEEWAYMAELLRTDGHITKDLKNVEIANNDFGVLERFKSFLFKIGIESDSIHQKPWNKGLYFKICNRTFARIMSSIFEIPVGKKCGIIFIPKIIKYSQPAVIASALRGAFDGDGWSCFRSRRTGIQLKSKQYVQDICELLQKLGISSYFRGPNKEDKYLCEVTRQQNLIRFQNIINFDNIKRKESLSRIVSNYRGRLNANNNIAC